MAFPDTNPRKGDSNNNLLFKIAQELSERNGGAYPPRLGDSDNNLLYKIAQLIILGGGTAGTCAADLAACNALVATLQAQIAANPQDMQVEWTPTNLKLGEMFGYGGGGTTNFPGITSITFKGATSQAGFTISSKSALTSLSFPNLVSVVANGLVASSNPLLTSVSAPQLVTVVNSVTLSTNVSLTSVDFSSLQSTSSNVFLPTNAALLSASFPALQTVGNTISFSGCTSLASLSLPLLQSFVNTFDFSGCNSLTSISLPSLTSGGIISGVNPLGITSISFPIVTTLTGSFTVSGATNLATVSLPSLITLGGSLNLPSNPALANLDLSSYVPTNGRIHTITGAALTAASVNQLLARCVANAAYVSGTINTSGGTSSAPTGQGIVDKATLQARGVTVTTN